MDRLSNVGCYTEGECKAVKMYGKLGALCFLFGACSSWLQGRQRQALAASEDVGHHAAHTTVDIVLAAYLESTVIQETIASLKQEIAFSQVAGRVIVVASDEETALAASAADVVLRLPRSGKPSAINAGVEFSTADIVVLSDANSIVGPPGWMRTVLSALGSFDLISCTKKETGESVDKLFWAMERLRRQREGAAVSLAVVGEMMAFRRIDYLPVPASVLSDDLWIALSFADRGLSTVCLSGVVASEPGTVGKDQWERRVRICTGQFELAKRAVSVATHSSAARSYLVSKFFRISLGNAGFWLMIFGLGGRQAKVVQGLALLSVAVYSGRLPAPRLIRACVGPVGMQGIPPLSLIRLLSRRRRKPESRLLGWEKVGR